MSTIQFEVNRYIYVLGFKREETWGGIPLQIQGLLSCYGGTGVRLVVYGLHPDSPAPEAPIYDAERRAGAIFVPFADLAAYVDLVRNESPIYARMDPDRPDLMQLTTSLEPIGEGE